MSGLNTGVEQTQYAVEVDSDEFQFRLKPFEISLKKAVCKICCLICFTYPVLVIFIAAILSVPLTYLAEWPPEESFFEILVELSSATADNVVSEDLGMESPFSNTLGAFLIVIIAGFLSMAIFGVLLGLFSGGPLDFPILKKAIETHYKWFEDSKQKDIIPIDLVLADQDRKEAKEELLRNDYEFYTNHIFPSPNSSANDSFLSIHWKMLCGFGCIVFPIMAVIISAIFGAILAFVEEEWTFLSGYYTVMQEILDLEVQLVDPPTATTFASRLLICVVAIWSNGYFFIILGLMSGPLLIPFIKKLETDHERVRTSMVDNSKCKLAKEVVTVSFLILPILIFGFALIFGIPLAIISPFTLGESISEAMSEITNMKSDIRDVDPGEVSGFTRFFLILIGIFGLLFFALTLGMFSYLFTARIAHALNLVPDYTKDYVVRNSIKKMVLFIAVGVPFIAVCISVIFGGILSLAESVAEGNLDLEKKWNFKVGFFVVLSELLDINVEIYDIPATDHGAGKIILALVGAFSYSLFTLVLAVIGGPILIPMMHYFAGTAFKMPHEED